MPPIVPKWPSWLSDHGVQCFLKRELEEAASSIVQESEPAAFLFLYEAALSSLVWLPFPTVDAHRPIVFLVRPRRSTSDVGSRWRTGCQQVPGKSRLHNSRPQCPLPRGRAGYRGTRWSVSCFCRSPYPAITETRGNLGECYPLQTTTHRASCTTLSSGTSTSFRSLSF